MPGMRARRFHGGVRAAPISTMRRSYAMRTRVGANVVYHLSCMVRALLSVPPTILTIYLYYPPSRCSPPYVEQASPRLCRLVRVLLHGPKVTTLTCANAGRGARPRNRPN